MSQSWSYSVVFIFRRDGKLIEKSTIYIYMGKHIKIDEFLNNFVDEAFIWIWI